MLCRRDAIYFAPRSDTKTRYNDAINRAQDDGLAGDVFEILDLVGKYHNTVAGLERFEVAALDKLSKCIGA